MLGKLIPKKDTRERPMGAYIPPGALSGIPIGGEITYYGHSEPTDWKFPNGQELEISQYQECYNALTVNGTVFPFGANTDGAGGPGSTHFRLPNARGRVAVMRDLSAGVLTGTDTLGTTGGTQTHALTPAQAPLRTHTHSGTTASDNTDHSHSGTTGTVSADHGHSGTTGDINQNHQHSMQFAYPTGPILHNLRVNDGAQVSRYVGQGATGVANTGTVTSGHTHNFSTGGISANHTHGITTGGRSAFHQHTFTTGNPSLAEANGSAHENMQPHMRVNKLIRVR